MRPPCGPFTVKGGTEQQSITLSPTKANDQVGQAGKGGWSVVLGVSVKVGGVLTDENITGEYISTTGELSAGADVYYRTDAPKYDPPLPSEQDKLNTLTMYAPETEITDTGRFVIWNWTYTVDTGNPI